MALTSSLLAFVVAMLLAACATGPRVVALPGTGKTFEQFTADDSACRTWASQQEGSGAQWRYDMAYTQCMYARGNRVPVSGGAWESMPPRPAPAGTLPADIPPPPPGTPPPPPPGPSR
ncbi:MAG TPA: glycine zipper family protein [Methylomirabilota bacterium]|jgi:hypothetical protein